MVSLSPDTQSYNFTHMYDFIDYKGNKAPELSKKNTIYNFLVNNPNFSKALSLVNKAMFDGDFNSEQGNFTLFVPSNDSLKNIPDEYFNTMNVGTAKHIINASTLNRRVPKKNLMFSPVAYFNTRNATMRMYITNINDITIINECVNVVKYDINFENGIIHVVDNFIFPTTKTYMS